MADSGIVVEPNGKVAAANNGTPHLSRVLGLWDVVFYGMVLAASHGDGAQGRTNSPQNFRCTFQCVIDPASGGR